MPSFGVAILLTAGTAACSGDGPGRAEPDRQAQPSPDVTEEARTAEEFIAETDEVCRDTAEAVVANDARYSPDTTQKQSIRIEQETARLASERLEQLEAIEPPADLRDEYDEYLSLRREALRTFDRLLAAWKKDDMRRRDKLNRRLNADVERFNETGEEVGFFACANRLPQDDRKEVVNNATRYFKNPAPRVCKKVFTKDLLREIEGPDECPNLLTGSRRARVKDIGGVEGVRADAKVTVTSHPDTVFEVTLLYEDGTYKIERYEVKTT